MDTRRFSERVAGHGALMTCMMERVGVDHADVRRVDGGLGLLAAQTKCIFCADRGACKAWLADSRSTTDPAAFCPNISFFKGARDLS